MILVIGITEVLAILALGLGVLEGFTMKTLFITITFAVGMVLATQAALLVGECRMHGGPLGVYPTTNGKHDDGHCGKLDDNFASDVTDCPHIVWKHGHYVCVFEENS
jgi:hypothetical protein